jgi:WhiB family redox-sensing transcriptional regulator
MNPHDDMTTDDTSTPDQGIGRRRAADPDSVTGWMSEGTCRLHPPAVFFPSDGAGVDRARAICGRCPVAERCLEYALDNRIEHGVWGGASERERRRILRRRRIPVSGD